MHSPCSLLAAAVFFAVFISSPRCVCAQDNPATVTNSIGMQLVLIPQGTFQMGAPFEEEFARDDEEPHEVTLSRDYYLGVTEVTQGQYEKVMGANPAHFQKRVIRKTDSSMYPVEQVSWERAVEFCRKLSELPEEKAAGRVYGLPTEAEWEYACRAGSKTAYSSGESPQSLNDCTWLGTNSNNTTHPVGEKKANAWGLFDMHGNVSEWCNDRYGAYPKAAVSDPAGPQRGSSRVYRGGSIYHSASLCRSSVRFSEDPTVRQRSIGFRVALSPFGISRAEDALAAMKPRQKPATDALAAMGARQEPAEDAPAPGDLLKIPEDGVAVTKGSFTAFTIPAAPQPRQAYSIVIEVKLPDDVKTYPVSDLSGKVRGTDGYEQKLPYDTRTPGAAGYPAAGGSTRRIESSTILDVVQNKVQIVIRVPGGARLVKDVITVRSRRLKEDQELELIFGQARE